MSSSIAYQPYRRKFANPLRTAHGIWSLREGFVVRVESDAGVGYGEIAPIPEFGSETLEMARMFLDQLVQQPDLPVPQALPCCAFGVSAAKRGWEAGRPVPDLKIAGLLPAGSAALEVLPRRLAKGFDVFKWKIGVETPSLELAILAQLMALLPSHARLRLDANGGLSRPQMEEWLAALSQYGERIDYFEQPLPVGAEESMAEAMRTFGVNIALDESLNGQQGADWLQQWEGPLVIKPLLMGAIEPLLSILAPISARVVLSSVFETRIGGGNVLTMLQQLPDMKRALGFDTSKAFHDGWSLTVKDSSIRGLMPTKVSAEKLWKQLHHSN